MVGLKVIVTTPPVIPKCMNDWLDLIEDRRPTEDKFMRARFLMMVQLRNTNPDIAWQCRLWHGNAQRRGKIVHSQPGGPWMSGWPGWDDYIPEIPDLEIALGVWYYRHPEIKRPAVNGRKLGHVSLRFEVLARDGFTCRYCGRAAPDVVLHVDHVVPASKGGQDTLENLVASCRECNLGKRDVLLPALVEAAL